jgi:hypothetical protein
MPHCRRCPTRGPWAILRGLVRPGTRYRALLGGGCHRSRFCNRSMGAEKGADMAHRQRKLVWSVLPRIKTHLRVGREIHGLHRYGIGVPRNVERRVASRLPTQIWRTQIAAYDAIVIGTGTAGSYLAERLARSGKKVAAIERKLVGGTCPNVGCTPTNTGFQ